jgi:hypothetical protein
MTDTTVHAPAVPSASADDSGHDSRAESTVMAASSSPTCGATRMVKGGDYRAHRLLQEDDRRAYHDHGWLTDNLVSFIPEVDVPTVEGSTIICFESQLSAGI